MFAILFALKYIALAYNRATLRLCLLYLLIYNLYSLLLTSSCLQQCAIIVLMFSADIVYNFCVFTLITSDRKKCLVKLVKNLRRNRHLALYQTSDYLEIYQEHIIKMPFLQVWLMSKTCYVVIRVMTTSKGLNFPPDTLHCLLQ